MPITLKSTGGGSVSIDVPSTGSTFTLTAPANNATIFTTDGGAITGNVAFTSNNVSIGGQTIAPNLGMKNRIINGDMRIDQRNSGASANNQAATVFSVDRWQTFGSVTTKFSFQQNAGSVTPPPGFTNYLGVTSLTSYSVTSTDYNYVAQSVEGYSVADLDLGKSTCKSMTLSFWVRSSLTGTFGGSFYQSGSRNFPFSYVINSANTWEYKTITVPPDTSGTSYATTTSNAFYLMFGLGTGATYSSGAAGSWSNSNNIQASGTVSLVGTQGATWYITGVQLEAGSVATPFERRLYGQELALCQRYCHVLGVGSTTETIATASSYTSGSNYFSYRLPVSMRAAPTIVGTNSASGTLAGAAGTPSWTTLTYGSYANPNTVEFYVNGSTTGGYAYIVRQTSGICVLSAEL